MKLRADKFLIASNKKQMMKIQEQALKYTDDIKCKTIEDANAVLNLYAQISFDEGYRHALAEMKNDFKDYKEIKIKKRRKGFFEYVEIEDLKNSSDLCKKRMKSKTQRKYRDKYCKEKGIENNEETFVLSMVVHTFFEAGYLKANQPEEVAKIFGKNDVSVKILTELLKDINE